MGTPPTPAACTAGALTRSARAKVEPVVPPLNATRYGVPRTVGPLKVRTNLTAEFHLRR